MQIQTISRPPGVKPIAIEVDGEPLGVVVPSDAGYRFLAVRFAAFPHDGRLFESVEDARLALGKALHNGSDR
jgi:hypothetical protein